MCIDPNLSVIYPEPAAPGVNKLLRAFL